MTRRYRSYGRDLYEARMAKKRRRESSRRLDLLEEALFERRRAVRAFVEHVHITRFRQSRGWE